MHTHQASIHFMQSRKSLLSKNPGIFVRWHADFLCSFEKNLCCLLPFEQFWIPSKDLHSKKHFTFRIHKTTNFFRTW